MRHCVFHALQLWMGLASLTAFAFSAEGCGFSSPVAASCGRDATEGFITCALNMAPVVAVGSDTRKIVYQTPSTIRVSHGETCVSAPRAADSKAFAFRVQQSETLPPAYGDSATVFMNGWNLRYANGDHHVQGFGSAIVNIKESRQPDGLLLQWEAGGVLSDQNGDDPYEWCYTYTIVGWARSSRGFDAVVGERGLTFMRPADPGNSTALHAINGAARSVYGPGVVLPQGFAVMWNDSGDKHVLQAGFDLGQRYSAGAGQMGWTSRVLLKDNDAANDFYAGELVSTMTYGGPDSYHPTAVYLQTAQGYEARTNGVSLTPMSSDSFCTAVGNSTPTVQHYRIDNVPYAYAVPVLSGWEMGYLCTDHHVREIGAAITDFNYVRSPDGTAGTLYYTLEVVLNDDSGNISYAAASVDVFGMKPLQTAPLPALAPEDDQLDAETPVDAGIDADAESVVDEEAEVEQL